MALSASAAWAKPSTSAPQYEDPAIIRAAADRELLGPATPRAPSLPTIKTTKAQVWVSSAIKLPPIAVPDIRARVLKLGRADRRWLGPQLRKSLSVVAFFDNPKNRWVIAPKHAKCWTVAWERQCTLARAKLRLHHQLAETAQYRLDHELPLIGDWVTAVRYVCTKVYARPDVCSFLLGTSDREGGHGEWVWYGGRPWRGYHVGDDFLGADTVGGWMQFRFSTFAPYYRGMVKDMRARGFTLPRWPDRGGPEAYQPWLDPLAQALTAGYMKYYGKEGCHWCL